MDFDFESDPLGRDEAGQPIFLRDIWPTTREVNSVIRKTITKQMFVKKYADVFKGDKNWQGIKVAGGQTYSWQGESTYVQNPPYFEGMGMAPSGVTDINEARILAVFGDSITTDHISPAGSIKKTSPAGEYLVGHGVDPLDFNSYGARRGNQGYFFEPTVITDLPDDSKLMTEEPFGPIAPIGMSRAAPISM